MVNKAIIFVDANNWYHNIKSSFRPSDIDIIKLKDFISKEKDLEILEMKNQNRQ